MQKIEIAKMELTDIPQIMALEKESGLECWAQQNYEESLKNPDYNIQVVKFEDKIIGFLSMYSASDEGYICNIAVDKAHRNYGIGTVLVEKIIEYSKQKCLKFLSLEVRESNTVAIKFYEKLGFAKLGIRKNFYSNPTEHALIMTKHF